MKHTQGKWEFDGCNIFTINADNSNYKNIADFGNGRYGASFTDDGLQNNISDAEHLANARLIATAPDMLAMLKIAVKYLAHEDVAKIGFALPSLTVANNINKLINQIEG